MEDTKSPSEELISKIKNHAYLCYFVGVMGIVFGVFFYYVDPILGILACIISTLYFGLGYWIQKRYAFIPSLLATSFFAFNTLSTILLAADVGYYRPNLIGLVVLFFMLKGTYINFKYNFLSNFGEPGPRKYF